MNHRMVSNNRSGSVTFWAWAVSIAVHLIVLTIFAVTKFSQPSLEDNRQSTSVAITKVNQVKKLIETEPVTPKPKVKKIAGSQPGKKGTGRLLPADQVFDVHRPVLQDSGNLSKSSAPITTLSATSGGILPGKIEFFGSFTNQRKICYVVDCSGSMQGVFGRVQKKLAESIESLQPDQYFCIIFFGEDKLFEFGDGGLVRATPQAKSAANNFINSIRPSGQTNALAALEKAVKVRDASGASPAVIYFLTDGFELTSESAHKFSQKIVNLLKRFAPATKINAIGFWPQGDDRYMLEAIAKQSGGEFVLVIDQ